MEKHHTFKHETPELGHQTSAESTVAHSLSWSSVLLEKLPIVQILKNFPAFYGTRRFITVFTRALHWSLY
jgi:hypothetical protein